MFGLDNGYFGILKSTPLQQTCCIPAYSVASGLLAKIMISQNVQSFNEQMIESVHDIQSLSH